MPIATHHFKTPTAWLGFFYYVQDERYFAGEHMDVRREAFQDGMAIRWALR